MMLKFIKSNILPIIGSFLSAFGTISLLIATYESVTNVDVVSPFWCFLLLTATIGIGYFLLDGFYISGNLKKRVEILNHGFDTRIFVEFGDLFKKQGWKAVATNDFFDSHVDEDLVSSKSLHGQTITKFWHDNRADWERQINTSLDRLECKKESRNKGNLKRYPIGTTADATIGVQKFLFVALTTTDSSNNVTTADAESLICAVRGMLAKARALCSYEPLAIPLMGSGLARVGIKPSVLVHLILAAIHEETRRGKITGQITIVLPHDKENEINLKNYERSWNANG